MDKKQLEKYIISLLNRIDDKGIGKFEKESIKDEFKKVAMDLFLDDINEFITYFGEEIYSQFSSKFPPMSIAMGLAIFGLHLNSAAGCSKETFIITLKDIEDNFKSQWNLRYKT